MAATKSDLHVRASLRQFGLRTVRVPARNADSPAVDIRLRNRLGLSAIGRRLVANTARRVGWRRIRRSELDRPDVRVNEVVALEEKRLVRDVRKRVRKAITVVQRCRVASLAETAIGPSRNVRLLAVDGNE